MDLVSADTTKVLVCSMNSHFGQFSYLHKLFGDPDDYVYKFGNDTFADKLPIRLHMFYKKYLYDFYHAVSIDYEVQRVYMTNNRFERLDYGLYVYNNLTATHTIYGVPETNQVTKR